jgi:hypothetical protein
VVRPIRLWVLKATAVDRAARVEERPAAQAEAWPAVKAAVVRAAVSVAVPVVATAADLVVGVVGLAPEVGPAVDPSWHR